MAGPIKPKDVQKARNESIPEQVYEAFNEMIVQNWDGREANFKLKDVANLALRKIQASYDQNMTRQGMYDRGWLDVESAYRKAGWKVEFDKAAYNETYDDNFTFRK